MKEKLSKLARGLTLRQLRALAAVADRGTVSGAAAALHLTPPAVAQQLRRLEDGVGAPLLERSEAGWRPTAAGAELLRAAAAIEAIIDESAEALATLASVEGGRIDVGVVSTAKYFAPQALAAFMRAHPGVDLGLRVGNRGETVAALERFDLDLAIMGRPPQDFAVEATAIGPHPHVIIAPPGHPLTRLQQARLEDLRGEPFLLREEGSGTRALAAALFAPLGLSSRVTEIGSNETIKQAVMAGMGLALISGHTIAHEVRDGRLAVLSVAGLPLVREWFVVRRAEKRLLRAPAALQRFLVERGRRFLPDLGPLAAGTQRGAPEQPPSLGRDDVVNGRPG
jgi:LysR family transcriptional regulator, low CO2-responsive transcriptional regulator